MDALISEVRTHTGPLSRRLRSALVDRALFVPEEHSNSAYEDHPLSIGEGQSMAAPHMHALMLKELEPSLPEGGKALDVGAGTGYVTACLRQLVGRQGKVVGVEVVPSLFHRATMFLRGWDSTACEDGTIKLFQGNVFQEDVYSELQNLGPYNAIHVGAGVCDEEAKEKLYDLLAIGGRLIMPFAMSANSPRVQMLRTYTKTVESAIVQDVVQVRFFPLVPHDSEGLQNGTLQSAEVVPLEHRWPPTPDSPEEPLIPSQDHVEEPRRRHCPCCCCVS